LAVFWNRTAREVKEARRRAVLDQLLDLEPAERRDRLEQAVAQGDVRSTEVEHALRLVSRLEDVRVMTIRGTRRDSATAAMPDDLVGAAAVEAPTGDPEATQPQPDALVWARNRRRKMSGRRGLRPGQAAPTRVAVPIVSRGGPDQDEPAHRAGAVPGTAQALGGSPRRRRSRLAAAASAAAAQLQADEAGQPDGVFAIATASVTPVEDQRPDISWLRP
jgi:hypothetical protein